MQRVSTLMHNAYKTICTKLKLTYEEQLTLSPLFGPNQAMKSVLSCISNNMPISSFGICCEYLSKNFGYDFDNYDSSYKTYIKILSFKTSVKVKFYMIKFFSIFEQIINFIKYRIKLIVWHSHIKDNKI